MEIVELEWDPTNVAKLGGHQIARWEVDELVNRGLYAVDVHPDYRDQVRITGPTRTGRFLTIALELVDETAGIWCPTTGWPATAGEEAYYWRESR